MKNYHKFSCVYCGQHIECEPALVGRQFHCPSCKQRIVVPPSSSHKSARPAAPVNATWDTTIPTPGAETPTRYDRREEIGSESA